MRTCPRYLQSPINICVSIPIIMWVYFCFVLVPTEKDYGTVSFPEVTVFKDVRKRNASLTVNTEPSQEDW